jgi:hypothetical protein
MYEQERQTSKECDVCGGTTARYGTFIAFVAIVTLCGRLGREERQLVVGHARGLIHHQSHDVVSDRLRPVSQAKSQVVRGNRRLVLRRQQVVAISNTCSTSHAGR